MKKSDLPNLLFQFGDEYGLMTPIPSPLNFQLQSDAFMGSEGKKV